MSKEQIVVTIAIGKYEELGDADVGVPGSMPDGDWLG